VTKGPPLESTARRIPDIARNMSALLDRHVGDPALLARFLYTLARAFENKNMEGMVAHEMLYWLNFAIMHVAELLSHAGSPEVKQHALRLIRCSWEHVDVDSRLAKLIDHTRMSAVLADGMTKPASCQLAVRAVTATVVSRDVARTYIAQGLHMDIEAALKGSKADLAHAGLR
jgi:hypothetical protein